MTVRQRIDHLAAEPPVGDLGYAADQRLVAGALLGLQLLADEIDALKAGFAGAAETGVGDDRYDRDIADRVAKKRTTRATSSGRPSRRSRGRT